MLNIHELETRWFKYKLKSYIPHAVIIISILIITLLLFITLNSIDTKVSTNNDKTEIVKTEMLIEKPPLNIVQNEINTTSQQSLPISDKQKEVVTMTERIPVQSIKKEKIILSPSLNFMKDMQNNTPMYYNEDETPKKEEETNTEKFNTNKEVKPQIIVEEIDEELKVVKQEDSINITKQNTQDDITHVIKRFKKNNNPTLSLFVAKKYYDMGEYRQSYNYSLITNQLNNNIEASWIIFTKSLVKLNEKDMAIKTLQQYIEHSHSNQAKILLDEITSGKFK